MGNKASKEKTDIEKGKVQTDKIDELVGTEKTIEDLRRFVYWNRNLQKKPQLILFVGTPGLGKTFTVQKFLDETVKMKNNSIHASDFLSKWVGKSEEKFKEIFEIASHHFINEGKPYGILLDEVEKIISSRAQDEGTTEGSTKSYLLQFISGSKQKPGVLIFAITNHPEQLDTAFVNRCDKIIKLELPTAEEKKRLFDYYIEDNDIRCNDISMERFRTVDTRMFSVRDLFTLIDTAMRNGPEKRRHCADHFIAFDGFDGVRKYVGCSCDYMNCGGFKADIYTIPHHQHRLSKLTLTDVHRGRKLMSVSTTMDDVEKINQWVNKEKKKKIPANSDTEQTNISLKREATMYNNDITCLVTFLIGVAALFIFAIVFIVSLL